ncbi:MAG TPA: ABC transporter ATP-binding protein [Beijerinckiaceae bacterium]|nr:ABC transporter ATP-binding protein [Methylobacteriaceae bacterium]HPG03014.1 ABC transporter ATP-binding protein [Rhodoblastus sp.]HRY04998.1 ABC transporter ATP-binding protein [Beijerinckiaceae bacterium]
MNDATFIKPAAGRPAAGAPAIEARDLVMRFGADGPSPVLAVDRVSFSLAPGEFVSLIGPSGCGKTTILNLLTGLLHETPEGKLEVLGKPPREGNPDIAYMLARDSLLPWRTALENAAYGMEIRGVPKQERETRALDLLKQVGLGDFADKYPKALSHGMRQRCALARTFALDSPVLLMDEPFGALDAQTKLTLEDVLMNLWSAHRKTVVFVTHDLAEAIALSDRVVVMSARPGRIIADVPIDLPRPRSVRKLQSDHRFHDLYAQLWGLLEQGTTGDE